MRANSRWDDFIDWLDYVVLRKLGLVRLKIHRAETFFYHNWLVDVAKNGGRMTKGEKSSILAWVEKNEKDKEEEE